MIQTTEGRLSHIEYVGRHASSIVYAVDLLLVDSDSFNAQQQKYLAGIKQGITIFLTIYNKKKPILGELTLNSFICMMDLNKLLSYIITGCAPFRLHDYLGFHLSDHHLNLAEQIAEYAGSIKTAFTHWRKDQAIVIEPAMRQIEDDIFLLSDEGFGFNDSEIRITFQRLIDSKMHLSDYVAANFAPPSDVEPISGRGSHYAHTLGFHADTLLTSSRLPTMTQMQIHLLERIAKHAEVFKVVCNAVTDTQIADIGIIEFAMPVLSSNYD